MPSTIASQGSKKKKILKEKDSPESNALPVTKIKDVESLNFPRGGALALTPLEMRDVADKAEKDILFQVCESMQHLTI